MSSYILRAVGLRRSHSVRCKTLHHADPVHAIVALSNGIADARLIAQASLRVAQAHTTSWVSRANAVKRNGFQYGSRWRPGLHQAEREQV
jgi:hypothetical protein